MVEKSLVTCAVTGIAAVGLHFVENFGAGFIISAFMAVTPALAVSPF